MILVENECHGEEKDIFCHFILKYSSSTFLPHFKKINDADVLPKLEDKLSDQS